MSKYDTSAEWTTHSAKTPPTAQFLNDVVDQDLERNALPIHRRRWDARTGMLVQERSPILPRVVAIDSAKVLCVAPRRFSVQIHDEILVTFVAGSSEMARAMMVEMCGRVGVELRKQIQKTDLLELKRKFERRSQVS